MSFQMQSISIELTGILCLFPSMLPASSPVDIDNQVYSLIGELKEWHTITLDFKGPDTGERAVGPNPFLDYRLQVRFTSPGSRTFNVPGFYAGDGKGSP